jgi:hypothetical protein
MLREKNINSIDLWSFYGVDWLIFAVETTLQNDTFHLGQLLYYKSYTNEQLVQTLIENITHENISDIAKKQMEKTRTNALSFHLYHLGSTDDLIICLYELVKWGNDGDCDIIRTVINQDIKYMRVSTSQNEQEFGEQLIKGYASRQWGLSDHFWKTYCNLLPTQIEMILNNVYDHLKQSKNSIVVTILTSCIFWKKRPLSITNFIYALYELTVQVNRQLTHLELDQITAIFNQPIH